MSTCDAPESIEFCNNSETTCGSEVRICVERSFARVSADSRFRGDSSDMVELQESSSGVFEQSQTIQTSTRGVHYNLVSPMSLHPEDTKASLAT